MPRSRDEFRLEILLRHARQKVAELEEQLSSASLEINKGTIQYFEKIALGCGGTIALVISFVGAKSEQLQPSWLLRSALLALALAMVCAMYRNWRYPYYVLAARYKQLDKAMLDEAKYKRDYLLQSNVHSLETGNLINTSDVEDNFGRAREVLNRKILEFEHKEANIYKELKVFEACTLVLATLGISFLVALIFFNF